MSPGDIPYSARNRRLKWETSRNPHRRATSPTRARGSARSNRSAAASRYAMIVCINDSGCVDHSRYRCRTEIACAAAIISASKSGLAKLFFTNNATRSSRKSLELPRTDVSPGSPVAINAARTSDVVASAKDGAPAMHVNPGATLARSAT